MKQLSLFLCLFFLLNVSNAQLENSNWCFGNNAMVNFNGSVPQAGTSGINNGFTDVATVSDQNGQLQFYTDGETIRGKNHQIMPNGTHLYGSGSIGANIQLLAIVPKPGSANLYYLFTESYGFSASSSSGRAGVYYSIIDMNLNNGNGDVVSGRKNIPLKDHNGVLLDYSNTNTPFKYARITTTLHFDGDKIWLVLLPVFYNGGGDIASRYIYSYLICNSGISNTQDGGNPLPTVYSNVDNTNYPMDYYTDSWGFIKISPNGSHLVDATLKSVNLFDYNNQTGTALFNKQIYNFFPSNLSSGWGLEFSPNSQFVYFSVMNSFMQEKANDLDASKRNDSVYIYQREITTKNSQNRIIGKFSIVSNNTNSFVPISNTRGYSLQRAIDNKIYVCVDNDDITMGGWNDWLGVIAQPDMAYPNCNFNQHEIRLASGTHHTCYLPQWVYKASISSNSPCVIGIWPKVYKAADGLLWLKQTTGNSLIALANIIDMPNNINHVGDVSSSSQEILNWVHYGQYSAYTKWTTPTVSPYTWSVPFNLPGGQLQFCQYPLSPIYVDEQTGGMVSGPTYLPNNVGQLIAEDNGIYVAYEGNAIRTYSPLQTRQFNLPFSSNGIVKAYFNSTSKKLFFTFYSNGNTYLIVYNLLNNGFLIPQHSSYYDLTGYRILNANTADELFVLNSGGVLQKFDYLNNTFTTQIIPNMNNQSLIAIGNDEQVVTDNILLKKENDYNIYAINTLSSTGKICYNSYMGSYSGYGVYSYFFDYTGQKVFVSGVYNTANYTISTQTMPNISAGSYYGQSTFVTKLDLTTDFTALKIGSANRVTPELYVQKSVSPKTSISDEKIGFFISHNPVKNLLGVNISGFNKITSQVSGYVTNPEGKKILTMPVLKQANSFNVSLLSPGIYYLTLFSKEKLIGTKLFLKE